MKAKIKSVVDSIVKKNKLLRPAIILVLIVSFIIPSILLYKHSLVGRQTRMRGWELYLRYTATYQSFYKSYYRECLQCLDVSRDMVQQVGEIMETNKPMGQDIVQKTTRRMAKISESLRSLPRQAMGFLKDIKFGKDAASRDVILGINAKNENVKLTQTMATLLLIYS